MSFPTIYNINIPTPKKEIFQPLDKNEIDKRLQALVAQNERIKEGMKQMDAFYYHHQRPISAIPIKVDSLKMPSS